MNNKAGLIDILETVKIKWKIENDLLVVDSSSQPDEYYFLEELVEAFEFSLIKREWNLSETQVKSIYMDKKSRILAA